MLDFDDNWEDNDFAVVAPVVQTQPIVQQQPQKPIQPVGSIGSTSKAHQQFQVKQGAVQTDSQQVQPEVSGSTNFFQDEWDPTSPPGKDSWAQNPMQTFAPTNVAFQQPVNVVQMEQKHEEEPPLQQQKVVVVKEEPEQPAKSSNRGVALNTSAKVNTWGNQSASSFAQKVPMKKKKARKQKQNTRKAPITSQITSQAVVQPVIQPVGPQTSVIQPAVGPQTVEPVQQSFTDQATIQELMSQVTALAARVNQLEQQKREALLEVCTLNSSGEINQDGYIFWNSNHILKPREQRYKLSDDLTRLVVKNRALYQITFNSSGENPMLVVDGDIYATTHTNGKSSNSVNLFLYLAEGAEISGAVNSAGSQNACEHWLCVRLIPSVST